MQNKIQNFSLGTDPELFLYSEEQQKFIPVCGLVGGTKTEPLPISDIKGFSLQEDNVALEFTIPPVKTIDDWVANINFVKNYISETILSPKGLIPKYVASARFATEDLQSEQAQVMGCDTSFNAWTFMPHEVDRSDFNLRTTGMHVHVGYDNHNPEISLDLIRAMDIFLGVPSVILDPDMERRKMYGKAGDYRIKHEYGVEYRCLSSHFLSNDDLLRWVYQNTLAAINFVNEGGIITNPHEIIQAIDTCNKDLAFEIMDDYKVAINNYTKTI